MCGPNWITAVKQSRETLETLGRKQDLGRGTWVLSAATPASGESVSVYMCAHVCMRTHWDWLTKGV